VFGPLELTMRTLHELEHFDDVAAMGRQRFGTQINNARLIGRLAATAGRRQFEHLLGGLARTMEPAQEAAPAIERAARSPGARTRPTVPAGAEAELAIPDYRALSASQVVRRLDGLGEEELRALYRYEADTRGRRTILHRAQQLLGLEEPPVPPASD